MTENEVKALLDGVIPAVRDYVDKRLAQFKAEQEAETAEALERFAARVSRLREGANR